MPGKHGGFYAVLKPGDTILGMSLAAGGHLTHGHPINFSGTYFKSVQYGVNRETELLDYDEIELLAHLHRPNLIIVGASAYSRIIDYARMRTIADSMTRIYWLIYAHIAGLIAAKPIHFLFRMLILSPARRIKHSVVLAAVSLCVKKHILPL